MYYSHDSAFAKSSKATSELHIALEDSGRLLIACRNIGKSPINFVPDSITVTLLNGDSDTNAELMSATPARNLLATIYAEGQNERAGEVFAGVLSAMAEQNPTARQLGLARTEANVDRIDASTSAALRSGYRNYLGRETIAPGEVVFGVVVIDQFFSSWGKAVQRIRIPVGSDVHMIEFRKTRDVIEPPKRIPPCEK